MNLAGAMQGAYDIGPMGQPIRFCASADKTVRNHITRIFDKLSVENRPQAIVRAREAGFGVKQPNG